MGWTPPFCWRTLCAAVFHLAWRSAPINSEGESKMHATTVAVDLAKNVFPLAVADASWKVIESHRLTRTQFERWFAKRDVGLVIMEACGSAHHWACFETDRPSWLNGSHPHATMPITLPVASCLPLVTIGTACADSMSARAKESPLSMPDIRLHALPNCQTYRSVLLTSGGVYI